MFLILDRRKLIKFAIKNRNGVWTFDTEKWSNLNNDLAVKVPCLKPMGGSKVDSASSKWL